VAQVTADKYEAFDDEYEDLPKRVKIQSSSKPVGSLTDNARKIKPNRDGAHKRVARLDKE
jgi:hypothetical protein